MIIKTRAEKDREARRFQLNKPVARIEAAGLLDKFDAKDPWRWRFISGQR